LPHVGGGIPRRDYGFLEAIGRGVLGKLGWHVEGEFPDLPRAVAVVAPHSSNWDFVIGISVVLAQRLRIAFIAKHTLFSGLLGVVMRWLGGIPVDRARPEGFVDTMVAEFSRRDKLWLAITPEGTRTDGVHFKSGFYRIAKAVGVPIIPVYLNYRRKVVGFLAPIQPDMETAQGVAAIRQLLEQRGARRPK
jgi:1-acyl-sn-glycerol-3-phosphate acyltransferase